MARTRHYWLMKSEPSVYSIDTLKDKGVDSWDGVRNFQARNYMMQMAKGDLAFFYHSNADPMGIAGIVEVVALAHPDLTAQDAESKYYDPKATADNPIWMMVDVRFKEKFARVVTLHELKATPGLEDMMVTRKGSRLSVQPVEKKAWDIILKLARKKPG